MAPTIHEAKIYQVNGSYFINPGTLLVDVRDVIEFRLINVDSAIIVFPRSDLFDPETMTITLGNNYPRSKSVIVSRSAPLRLLIQYPVSCGSSQNLAQGASPPSMIIDDPEEKDKDGGG